MRQDDRLAELNATLEEMRRVVLARVQRPAAAAVPTAKPAAAAPAEAPHLRSSGNTSFGSDSTFEGFFTSRFGKADGQQPGLIDRLFNLLRGRT